MGRVDRLTMESYDPTPEERLWRSVLCQAVRDAVGARFSGDGKIHSNHAIASARRFLRKPSDDLCEVCDRAGLNPEIVLRYAESILVTVH